VIVLPFLHVPNCIFCEPLILFIFLLQLHKISLNFILFHCFVIAMCDIIDNTYFFNAFVTKLYVQLDQ
jgi:hypothetical protein